MRITTQMINEGARKAGLPIQGTSLLDYLKKDTSTSLFGATNPNILGKNVNSGVDSVKKSSYEKLEKTADKLMNIIEKFTAEGDKSIFLGEDKQQIYDSAKTMIETYNSTIKQLKSSDSALDMYYEEMFDGVVNENKSALENIGISLSSKGTLSLDEAKMMETDMEVLENTLGASGMFSEKIGFLASRVSANAQSNVNSYSSLYGSSGDIQALFNSNKHDWWG